MLSPASELYVLGIYMPPSLVVCMLGLLCAVAVSQLLNWTGASRFFWHPPLVFLAVWVLASSLIGLGIIAP